MEKKIILWSEKSKCCGCGACVNACPCNAIKMKEDERGGFLYPIIDYELCIGCGKCKRVCAYQNQLEENNSKQAYVAMVKDENIILKSASGGVFASIGKNILQKSGVVFGCSMEYMDNQLNPRHIKVETEKELYKLQGSKYVQSSMHNTYKEVQEELIKERKVLFSGTPCQVAALKRFLNKEYSNLYTIDIICHGVPSARFFQDYIQVFEAKLKGKIQKFSFRDKSAGWGLRGSVVYVDKNGKERYKVLPVRLSSYYKMFLDSDIYRENCYRCKYANSNRVGDITIGDYWGVEKEHPEYLKQNGGTMDEIKGISCILVNNEQGKRMLDYFGEGLNLEVSTFEKVARENGQLNHPSKISNNRDHIFEMYVNGGYEAVEKWYNKKFGLKKYLYILWNSIPVNVKKILKKRGHKRGQTPVKKYKQY